MRVSAKGFELTVEDIPNVENLTSLDINLKEGTINLYYKGWEPIAYEGPRYDGELDDPEHPRPRPVKDNPQA